ncbi:hypothetical protein DFH29DRAFT_1081635 [Suillus ampliporus]|nr:hypothetical protein DFH29DRAFT_1081635 [Suillus ampliporus]
MPNIRSPSLRISLSSQIQRTNSSSSTTCRRRSHSSWSQLILCLRTTMDFSALVLMLLQHHLFSLELKTEAEIFLMLLVGMISEEYNAANPDQDKGSRHRDHERLIRYIWDCHNGLKRLQLSDSRVIASCCRENLLYRDAAASSYSYGLDVGGVTGMRLVPAPPAVASSCNYGLDIGGAVGLVATASSATMSGVVGDHRVWYWSDRAELVVLVDVNQGTPSISLSQTKRGVATSAPQSSDRNPRSFTYPSSMNYHSDIHGVLNSIAGINLAASGVMSLITRYLGLQHASFFAAFHVLVLPPTFPAATSKVRVHLKCTSQDPGYPHGLSETSEDTLATRSSMLPKTLIHRQGNLKSPCGHISFSATVRTARPNIQVPSTALPPFLYPTDTRMHVTASCHFGALRKTIESLQGCYEAFISTTPTPTPSPTHTLEYLYACAYKRMTTRSKRSFTYENESLSTAVDP